MARKRKAREGEGPSADGTSAANVPSTGDIAAIRADELRKWMAGESTLMAWLEEDPSQQPTFYNNVNILDFDPELKGRIAQYEAEIASLKSMPSTAGSTSDLEVVGLRAEIDRLTRANQELRDRAVASSPEELKGQEAKLRDLENELDARERALNLNGGEAAVVERLKAEMGSKASEASKRETDLRAKMEKADADLRAKEIELRLRDDELKMAKMSKPEASKELDQKLKGCQDRERSFMEMQDTVNGLQAQVAQRDDELNQLKEINTYRENELARREEDLSFRERKVTEERRRLEEAKRITGGLNEAELKKRLDELKAEIEQKERDLKAKEEYIRSKEAELRTREQGAIEEELKHKDAELAVEADSAKVKTGNPRLDDLLLGGIPFGSNVLVHGPPFVGKETMVNQFIAEGLKKGIPAIWVSTDKTTADLREEMKLVFPAYEEYEALGLVRYIDSYSRSMGDTTKDKYTIYIDEPTAHDKIMEAVDETAKVFKEKHDYYRLAFRTISTLIAYSDPNTAFRFLSPFCGRRKRDRAVTMYTIEKGMHGEQEIQMLGSIMDGMVDFKVDQLKLFFMIKGITDVQSRSYIRYTATRHGLTIGSFALDHIK